MLASSTCSVPELPFWVQTTWSPALPEPVTSMMSLSAAVPPSPAKPEIAAVKLLVKAEPEPSPVRSSVPPLVPETAAKSIGPVPIAAPESSRSVPPSMTGALATPPENTSSRPPP